MIKITQQESLELDGMDEATIRLREELAEQIRALFELKEMAASYGFDISRPATNAREAVQWVYFGYLGAVKEENGAAMSLGRVSTFLDIYSVFLVYEVGTRGAVPCPYGGDRAICGILHKPGIRCMISEKASDVILASAKNQKILPVYESK